NGHADATEAPALPAQGRPGTSAERLKSDWKRFDTDPVDDRLSPQEYLAAVQTHLGPAFAIRRKPPVLLQSVQLLPRLDGNHDGRITPTEIARGAQTLTALDFDDDGTFSPAELQPFPQSMLDAAMAEQREDSLEPFVLVDARSDRAELNSLLYRRYADDQGIAREHAGLSGIAFEEADADGN